jgi:COP9 signalosome complex subunit 4
MQNTLQELNNLAQRDKLAAYTSVLSRRLSSGEANLIEDISLLIRTVVNDDQVGLVVARQVLTDLNKALEHEEVKDKDTRKALLQQVLTALDPRLVSFEEQVGRIMVYSGCTT